MTKVDELDSKATFVQQKAEKLLASGKVAKAFKQFTKAADMFEQVALSTEEDAAWVLVIENLITSVKCALQEDALGPAAEIQLKLARIYLERGNRELAKEYYNVAVRYALKAEKVGASVACQAVVMHCFLQSLEASTEKAFDFFKKILNVLEDDAVKERYSFKLAKRFLAMEHVRKPLGIDVAMEKLEKERYTAAELRVMAHALHLKALLDGARFDFKVEGGKPGESLMEAQGIAATLDVQLPEDELLSEEVGDLVIETILVEKSNDLTIVQEFPVPATIPVGGKVALSTTFKSYYAGENEIGPLNLEIIAGDYKQSRNVDGIKFTLSARPANIQVLIEEGSEPLIGKSFPLTIEVRNESQGDARDVEVEVLLPEDEPISVTRGTLSKRFYSLPGGDSTSWEIKVRPDEEGTYPLTVVVKYKDGDNNPITEEFEVPLEIKI